MYGFRGMHTKSVSVEGLEAVFRQRLISILAVKIFSVNVVVRLKLRSRFPVYSVASIKTYIRFAKRKSSLKLSQYGIQCTLIFAYKL